MIRLLCVCALLVSATGPVAFEEEGEREGLEALEWMAGHWRQETKRGMTEEIWLPPRGGLMVGVNRTVRGDKAAFEYLRIQEDREGVVYYASPGGKPPTPFRLTEVDESHAVFENPEHDFPKRIEYRLDGERLVASIAGDTQGPSWTFERLTVLE